MVLYAELGERGAERVISLAMEDLAETLVGIETAAACGDRAQLTERLSHMEDLADQVGLTSMVVVARDLLNCIASGDGTAQAAVLARLMRVADRSLTEVWDLGDLRL
ncbi:hypothetical protein DL1_01700 [Thioclava dalianensis]|uniref:PhoU domain-containing protein n=1 Tax=Thioclava dalianensis TaxID=1185766 RepID=A0A074TLC3_9RHOB|nr:hypothetical protein DL1_01700 [Thioclava dalianensis]